MGISITDALLFPLSAGIPQSCPACDDSGIHVTVPAKATSFSYSTSTIKFEPQVNSNMQLTVPYDAFGGDVLGIENKNELSLTFRVLLSIGRLLPRLKIALGAKFGEDAKIIETRAKIVTDKITNITNILKAASPDYKNVFVTVLSLQEASKDLTAALVSVGERLETDPASVRAKASIRFLSLHLKRIDSITVIPKRTRVTTTSQGLILSYTGGICVYKLCLSNMDVAVYDLVDSVRTDPKCNNCSNLTVSRKQKNTIHVVGHTRGLVTLGTKLRIPSGSKFLLSVRKDSNEYEGVFSAQVKLFNTFYKAQFKVSKSLISFSAEDVAVAETLKFRVNESKDITRATWDSILSKIQGESIGNSTSIEDLQRRSEHFFIKIGQSTQKRVKKATDRVKESSNDFSKQNDIVKEKRRKLLNAAENLRITRLLYQRQLILLNRSQIELQSYLKDISPVFIKKNLTRVCKLSKCVDKCMTMPVCKVCQSPVNVAVNTLRCDQVTEKIRTTEVVQLKTKCSVMKYVFIPVYTGNCPEPAGMRAARDRQLRDNLVATGTAVGSLIGSIIPGLGTALGGAIGAAVGYFASLFSACDTSYEVYTKTYTVQVDCTKAWTRPKTIERAVSECYDVKQTVKSGYSEPKQCNCTTNPCVAKVKEPGCVLQNVKCQKLRTLFLKNTEKIPPKFTSTYALVQQAKSNVQAAQIKLRMSVQQKDFHQREYDRAINLAKHIREESFMANKSFNNIGEILLTETCILNYYQESSNLFTHLGIQKLTFDLTLPVLNNARIDAHVMNIKKGSTKTVPFVIQFNDREVSLDAASRKIVKQQLCQNSRRRRSLDDQEDYTGSLSSDIHVDTAQNVSSVKLACVSLQKTTEFLRHVTADLVNLTAEALDFASKVNESEKALANAKTEGNNSVLVAQKDAVIAVSDAMSVLRGRTMFSSIIKNWKKNAEVYTGFNNFTSCLGFEDCLDVAFESLYQLPTIFRVPRHDVMGNVNRTNELFNSILAKNHSLEELLSVANHLQNMIQELETNSLHCSALPKIELSSKVEITVLRGKYVSFRCRVESPLPLTIAWSRDEKIIEDKDKRYLRFKAAENLEGMYRCIATSLTGSATSNGTLLRVNWKPEFIENPKDIKFIKPFPETIKPTFFCNVTARPEAKISWHFISMIGKGNSELLVGKNSSILSVSPDHNANSGFYFCKAENIYGQIVSGRARLDILESTLATQVMKFSFDVVGENISKLNDISFRHLASRIKLNDMQQVSVTFKTKSAQRGTVVTKVIVKPSATLNNSKAAMLNVAAKTRQGLANSVATILGDILLNGSHIKSLEGRRLLVDNETIHSEFKGDICQPGSIPQKDGFTCGKLSTVPFYMAYY